MKAASFLDRLIAASPEECLQGEESLRVPTAVIYALIDHPEKSVQLLTRRITYQQAPPRGGWRNPPGTPPPADANAPRVITKPAPGEATSLVKSVINTLRAMGTDAVTIQAAQRAFTSISQTE